jgi:hypothetical protein
VDATKVGADEKGFEVGLIVGSDVGINTNSDVGLDVRVCVMKLVLQ